jgi:hypothetical protein
MHLIFSDQFMHPLDLFDYCIPFQPETTESPAISRSGKPIHYYPPRRAPYIGHNAPSISSVMQGPKINPSPDNLPLLTLKRKDMSRKVLVHRTKKKKIDTVVVNIPDMDGKLVGAFEV